MPQGLSYSQLPIAPATAQPQGLNGGGQQEQQMQQIMQLIAQKASDPNKRREMAQVLARQLPPPPDGIFNSGLRGVGHQPLPQGGNQMPNLAGLGSMISPMMAPQQPTQLPPGIFQPGGNQQAAVTMAQTNGPAAIQPGGNGMQTLPNPYLYQPQF